jgi:hypothetical protein
VGLVGSGHDKLLGFLRSLIWGVVYLLEVFLVKDVLFHVSDAINLIMGIEF